MKTDKILTRIRRLLNMAGDTSSPHEATIAASRARFLMDQHQITELDLKQNRPEDFGTAEQLHAETYQGMLGIAMAWLNDVNCRIVTEDGFDYLRFQGYLVDAVTAKELWLYLVAQCENQAKSIRGRKSSFKKGFAAGVQQHVQEILKERNQLKNSTGTSLVVTKRAIVTGKFGTMPTRKVRGTRNTNYHAGRAAGYKTGLDRQVSTATSKSNYLQ